MLILYFRIKHTVCRILCLFFNLNVHQKPNGETFLTPKLFHVYKKNLDSEFTVPVWTCQNNFQTVKLFLLKPKINTCSPSFKLMMLVQTSGVSWLQARIEAWTIACSVAVSPSIMTIVMSASGRLKVIISSESLSCEAIETNATVAASLARSFG